MRLAYLYHTLALSAGADFARRLSVPGAASSNGRMDASEQTAQYPTSMDGGSGATRTPRRNGLDAQPPFCPVPGIEGQRQRQRTGQTQNPGSLPGSTSPSNCHSGLLRGSRQATTQPQTQRGEGHPDIDRDQMSEMPGIQLDQQRAVQILRDTPNQDSGYLHQLYSTIAAGGQATRHYARQILCGCRRRFTPSKPVCTGLGQGGSLQTPGGIGDCDRDLAGRIPSQDGAFHSARLRQREVEGPQTAGSQARFGNSRGKEGHRQAGKGRRIPEAGTGGIGTGPTPGDQGHPRTGGCQSCSSSTSTSGNPPAGLRVLVVRRCSRTYLLLPRTSGRKGGRARRRASLQKGPGRTLWGDSEPEGGKRRGSARKIGKGPGIFGLYAESEFEIWGWVLPGSHPRNSLPERLWQRQRRCSRSQCRAPQRPSASPCPHGGEGKGSHPTHPGGPRLCNAGCTGQVGSPLLRGCGGLIWLCSFLCLVAQMWIDVSFFAACQTEPVSTDGSPCLASTTVVGVPSQHEAAACQHACGMQCTASFRENEHAAASCRSPLPGSWTPTIENRQDRCTCPSLDHLPGSMITKEHMGTAAQYLIGHSIGYEAQMRLSSVLGDSRTPGVSAHTLDCHSACLSQAHHRHSPSPCYGRTPGAPAYACDRLSTCQGQDDHDLLCLVELPGSFHLQPLCSHIGTSGGYGHNNPLSESPGGLSETPPSPALPVCHLGLPGSAGMADSRMASPAAAQGRLTICSVGMRHVEKNHRLGTQILPGSISGFYHREQYQAARHVLERCFRARFIEIVDLRPLKDARSYPDLRDHMGWHPTNCLINMHDRSLRDIAARIVEALRELANRARGERGTPGDCLLLLGCNQGRHRSPMIRYLLTRWMEESHGMTVDSSDVDNVHWRRHGECTLARQCVHCDVRNHDATREACVAWFKHEMDLAIQHITSATWATANEISWLGLRDLGIERLPPGPPLPDLPEGLFHAERDYSPPPHDPRSRSRGLSGGVSLGRGESRPPPGGRSITPGPRHRQQGKGASQGSPPQLTHVSRWTRAQQAQGKGKGAARPVTLHPAPSQGPPAAHVAPAVRHAGAAVDVIEVDPTPGVPDRAASVIDVDALPATVDAGVSEASITHCLNLLRTALLNNEITEEQSSHLSRLSLSTRSQTVGLWDVGTQTADYGPVQGGTARQSPANPYTNPVSTSAM